METRKMGEGPILWDEKLTSSLKVNSCVTPCISLLFNCHARFNTFPSEQGTENWKRSNRSLLMCSYVYIFYFCGNRFSNYVSYNYLCMCVHTNIHAYLVVKPKEPDKGVRTDRIPRGPITRMHSEWETKA